MRDTWRRLGWTSVPAVPLGGVHHLSLLQNPKLSSISKKPSERASERERERDFGERAMGLIRASTANQSGGDEEGSNGGRGGIINGNSNAIVVVNSGVVNHAKGDQKPLRHNPGVKPWTQEELDILEEELAKNSNEPLLTRYTNISLLFSNKTVRDVVLFCKWRAERIAGRNAQQLASPAISEDNDDDDDDSNEAIGDAKGLLLEKNLQLFDQISTCFETSQIQENINLLSQIRNNILTVMTDFHEMPNKHLPQLPPLPVKQLPPLPVKLNEELANLVLPKKIS